MKRKIFTLVIIIFVVMAISVTTNKLTSLTMNADGAYLKKSIDEKIREAEIIVIGDVVNNQPSRWNAPNGNDSKNASPEDVSRAHGLFTDSVISIQQTIKGDVHTPVVRVRSFIGEIETVIWVNESQPIFVKGKSYLLFLEKDQGATAKIDQGHYVSVNANMAVYEIVDGRAISTDDEWILEDLIAYIQNALQNGQ